VWTVTELAEESKACEANEIGEGAGVKETGAEYEGKVGDGEAGDKEVKGDEAEGEEAEDRGE